MAAAGAREKPQSSNPLDNFSFPILKRWGNQRMLRCANVNRKGEIIGGDRRSPLQAATSERRALPAGARIRVPEEHSEDSDGDGDDDGGLEELRTKLMGHLREAADWIKIGVAPPFFAGKAAEGNVPVPVPVAVPSPARAMEAGLAPEPEPEPSSSAAEAARPWNLRTRRAACKGPIGNGGRQPSSNPASAAERDGQERTVRLRSESARKRERPKLSVALTPEEIEEDIYAVTGSRPRRRPKKRPRIVQNQLDSLFPGLWLSEITAGLYKVPDD